MVTWLYFPSNENRYPDSALDEENPLFSDFLRSKIQRTEPSINKIYIDVLQALKSVESQWYSIIRILYVVDCELGLLDTLLYKLLQPPTSSDAVAIKGNLSEMLYLLRESLRKLQALEFHLHEIDSMLAEVGIGV